MAFAKYALTKEINEEEENGEDVVQMEYPSKEGIQRSRKISWIVVT